ncbi:uncharacterized protein LOC125885137 isoform X2 [Epinephelus fuscoguttatus]|uniref:uncharacterized protein LOC125885137 isoform X2 n=1 Tax=Epinephelus fuscoguttatus TaxID=293821 RepID=UPI0020D19BFF|nr:uncharacterized protein LOC125885137 isoform X2 [Epinephelus fuscoguttatus]
MVKWELCFVLLLPLTMCFDSEVTVVKTISREPDVTPICTNATLSPIILILCKIGTVMNRREECVLSYQYAKGFEHGCDSRFTLVTKNQTVFLQLTGLTPVDSGNYRCECTHHGGIDIFHLNITVEEDEDSSSFPKKVIEALTGAAMIMLLSAVIFGLLYRGMRQGSQPEPPSSHHKTEPEDIEPYSTFVQREGGLYSVVRLHVCDTDTINSNTVTTQDTHAGNFLQSSNYTVCAK